MINNEPMHSDAMHMKMDGAIRICLDCHSTCEYTIQHCLEKGAMHAAAAHIALMRDCAQLCITCADFMSRSSSLHVSVSKLCADACEACLESCKTMNDDAHMQSCIDACQACMDSCRAMSQMN